MRERAELLGGQFQVASAPGQGTRVQLCWPLSLRTAAYADMADLDAEPQARVADGLSLAA
jgi:signal transduction histidine kinase